MAEKNERAIKVVAENRKARFNYAIEDTVEAGIALTGTEVKSIRNGKTTIAESYADSKNGEIWLINANIPEYLQANRFNHEPKRPRKLLLHKKQINRLMGAVEREGMTLIPLKLYFNERGRAKLLLAVAKGKKLHDKRESEKKRDWSREKGRLLRARGEPCPYAYSSFSSLRANGSRECAPDDRLRDAIHSTAKEDGLLRRKCSSQ